MTAVEPANGHSQSPQTTPARDGVTVSLSNIAAAAPATAPQRADARAVATPRIALLGNYGSENLGNEGSLEAVLNALRTRYPKATFACVCPNPARAEVLHGVSSIQLTTPHFSNPRLRWLDSHLYGLLRRLFALITATFVLRGFDLILVPGTGILDDFGERPGAMPFEMLRWTLAARLAGRPFSFLSIGAGPIRNKLNRRLMLWAARFASSRSYRDRQSKDYMQSIGLNVERDSVLPDVAFLLPTPPPDGASVAGSLPPHRPAIIGLGVMEYSGWFPNLKESSGIHRTYTDKIVAVALTEISRDRQVRLLIGQHSDLYTARDIARRVIAASEKAEGNIQIEHAANLHEVMTQMADVDVVVATRFHNVVCALKMGKPVVSLGYADKNDVLLAEMGMLEFCRHVDTFDPEWVSASIDAALKRRDELSSRIAVTAAAYKAELDAALPQLVDNLLSKSSPARTAKALNQA